MDVVFHFSKENTYAGLRIISSLIAFTKSFVMLSGCRVTFNEVYLCRFLGRCANVVFLLVSSLAMTLIGVPVASSIAINSRLFISRLTINLHYVLLTTASRRSS